MTDTTGNLSISDAVRARIARRYRAERRFRLYGMAAVLSAVLFLVVMLATMIHGALPSFTSYSVELSVKYDRAEIAPGGKPTAEDMRNVNFQALARNGLRALFPGVTGRRDKRALGKLLSAGAGDAVRDRLIDDPDVLGTRIKLSLPLSDDADLYLKGLAAEAGGRLSDKQRGWLDRLKAQKIAASGFNTRFFTSGDSREPELAGILGAVTGSFLTLLVCLAMSFPLGVTAAVYLEEFAPKNRWTELIEVNINNLAAVPSIVFGILGLAIFLGFFGMPRSAPLVGGMVLALMTLPTIIIATRAAIKAVPPSIREAALGIGASDLQVVLHHVFPLAMPGILTGSIVGMARALGESAPLLMVGMVGMSTMKATMPTISKGESAPLLMVGMVAFSNEWRSGLSAQTV
jgi:phosphate transport system permease protein